MRKRHPLIDDGDPREYTLTYPPRVATSQKTHKKNIDIYSRQIQWIDTKKIGSFSSSVRLIIDFFIEFYDCDIDTIATASPPASKIMKKFKESYGGSYIKNIKDLHKKSIFFRHYQIKWINENKPGYDSFSSSVRLIIDFFIEFYDCDIDTIATASPPASKIMKKFK